MSYENTSGIGVGKTFGPRTTGAINGEVKTAGKEVQVTFDISAGTTGDEYKVNVLKDYVITGLTLYVTEPFGSGATANLSVNSGAGLSTALNLNTTGISKPALSGLGNVSGTGGEIVLDLSDAQTQSATEGEASVIVTYERI